MLSKYVLAPMPEVEVVSADTSKRFNYLLCEECFDSCKEFFRIAGPANEINQFNNRVERCGSTKCKKKARYRIFPVYFLSSVY